MDSRATKQCNMTPCVYTVYWLPPASSGFLLTRKAIDWLKNANNMRNARAYKLQLCGPTVHSSTVVTTKLADLKRFE